MADLSELRAELRDRGLRATGSRLEVMQLLRAQGVPLSHAEVCERLAGKTWDRATIYRNLTDLAEAGLLRRTDHGDHVWRFVAVDSVHADDAEAHPHFVCTECGAVECLPDATVDVGRRAPRAVRRRQVEIQVRGRCDGCG